MADVDMTDAPIQNKSTETTAVDDKKRFVVKKVHLPTKALLSIANA